MSADKPCNAAGVVVSYKQYCHPNAAEDHYEQR